jgi:IS4 transposase
MYRITTFREILKGLPRGAFDQIVKRHNGDKYSKKFGHWDQLLAMIYAQLSGATGLRPLETAFNNHAAHHYHLGTQPIKRSTLADANSTRKDVVFTETVQMLMQAVSQSLRSETGQLLYLLDSSPNTLKGREFDGWTAANRTRNTQGVKLHVLLDRNAAVPVWHSISAANVNDVEMATQVPLQPAATYVFDKGYCDYNWWQQIDRVGAYFVTRFKRNAAIRTERQQAIPGDAAGTVLEDCIVRFKYKNQSGGRRNTYQNDLRRVTIVRPDKPTPLVLATNDLTSSALEIAQRYKERWDIELFFKWIKQHLKIKSFLGRSENAVRIQLLTALISYLLVAIYKKTHGLKESLWDCLCLVRATLFQRPDSAPSEFRQRRKILEEQRKRQGLLFN